MLFNARPAFRFLCALIAATSLSAVSVSADDQQEVIDELRARIEALERQNNDLTRLSRSGGRPASRSGTIHLVADIEGPLGAEDYPLERLEQIEQETTGMGEDGNTLNTNPAGPSKGPVMTPRWGTRFVNNGLWFETEDKAFRVHIGGRTQWDMAWFHTSDQVQFGPGGIGPLHDGTDFRRARLRAEGSMYEQMQWCVEYDFVDSTQAAGNAFNIPSPRDLWWNFSNVPWVGNIRLGNQKEPYGFERILSSRWLTFMERSFNTEAFYSPFSAGFSPGVQLFNTAMDDNMTWAVGVFRNLNNGFVYNVGSDDWAFSGRLTYLPWYEDDGREVVHLGISARHTGLNNGIVQYRVRGPERAGPSTLWPRYASVTGIRGDGQEDVNFEFVSVMGAWSLQSEYNLNFVPNASQGGNPSVGTLVYQGGYAEVAYFLTGEYRQYVKSAATFDRIVPCRNAYAVRTDQGDKFGPGAWQVAFRYNYLNLNDKGINGGILNDYTWGLNWFINPNTKLQWNYSLTQRTSGTGGSDGLIQGAGMRFAHDF